MTALVATEVLDPVSLILQLFSTSACLLLALLAGQSGHKTATAVISATSFGICFLALLVGGTMAMRAISEIVAMKFIVLLVYGGMFGLFGVGFSVIAGRFEGDAAGASPPETGDGKATEERTEVDIANA